MKTIACDLDGVIIFHKTIPTREDWWRDKPHKNAKEAITYLNKKHGVVIFTARTPDQWPKIRRWLKKYKFPELEITNTKRKDFKKFIDDRAIRFTSWIDIVKLIG